MGLVKTKRVSAGIHARATVESSIWWYFLAMSELGRGVHDVGGLPGEALNRDEHELAFWEKRVDALLMLLVDKQGVMTVDELRRGIEQLGEGAYGELGYYERWMASISQNLLEKGVLTSDEMARKLAELEQRAAATAQVSASFYPGDRVTVRRASPPGHLRTPYYIRGRTGAIERSCGEFGNPEELAFGRRDGNRVPLYRVRFDLGEVWPDYAGASEDTIDVELYGHWLEPAEEGQDG